MAGLFIFVGWLPSSAQTPLQIYLHRQLIDLAKTWFSQKSKDVCSLNSELLKTSKLLLVFSFLPVHFPLFCCWAFSYISSSADARSVLMCFPQFYSTFLFSCSSYLPNIDICLWSGHVVYKIATITLFLKKDKEFAARPITSTVLTLGRCLQSKYFYNPIALLDWFVLGMYHQLDNFFLKRPGS